MEEVGNIFLKKMSETYHMSLIFMCFLQNSTIFQVYGGMYLLLVKQGSHTMYF
jgi:hypothetical protein